MDGHIENVTQYLEANGAALHDESIFELFQTSSLNEKNNVFYETSAQFHSDCLHDFAKTIIIVTRF
jgi:hypothetical protein